MGAPTPRRSGRISNKASSVADTAVTNLTSGGTRTRRPGPLAKVKARKSNAYGASGRVGAAEALSVSTTGFAQAFENQRGGAFSRDEGKEDDDGSVDELGAETPRMSGARNGHRPASSSPAPTSPPPTSPSPAPALEVLPPTSAPGLSFLQSEDTPLTDDDPAASVDNTSKSFGPLHEAGMLVPQERPYRHMSSSQASLNPTPVVHKTTARPSLPPQTHISADSLLKVPLQTYGRPPVRPTHLQTPAPGRIGPSVDDLFAEEQARLRRTGPPQPLSQPRAQQQSRERRRRDNNPQVSEWLGNVEPPQKDEVDWPWRHYLTWTFWIIAAVMLSGWLLRSLASVPPDASTSESNAGFADVFSAVNARVSYTMGRVAKYIEPPGSPTIEDEVAAFKAGDDNIMWHRMYKMNDNFNNRINGVHATIDELRDQLPDMLLVRRYEDGRSEISDDFWQALLTKLRSEEDDAEWLEFLKQTKQKLDDIFDHSVERDDTAVRPQAVSRQEFLTLLDERFRELSPRINEKIIRTMEHESNRLKTFISDEARNALIENVRLQSLAQAHLVANYELHLQSPNYFSVGLGAVIDPQLTSTTRLKHPHWFTGLGKKLALVPHRNPPQAALVEWRQPGDCWCSAPNSRGGAQSQLTVSLGRAMKPRKVTIEHIPMSMVPARDVSNAPRDVELWVETDQPILSYYSTLRPTGCSEGIPGWKCVGKFKYNIYAPNHVQTFDLEGEPTVPITRTMLRVTSNWGADHTCLYQVRLHGQDAMKDFEYGVELND